MSEARVCAACQRLQAFPLPVCRGCGSHRFVQCTLPFRAEIYSQTTVSRAPTAALQAEAPYTALLVRGAGGGLLLLRLIGDTPPGIGAAVTVCERDGALVAECVSSGTGS